MLMSRALSRASRSVGQRFLPLLSASQKKQQQPILSNQLHSIVHEYPNKFILGQISLFHHSALSFSPFHRFGFNSSASPEATEKEQGSSAATSGASTNAEVEKPSDNAEDQAEKSTSEESKESDSDADNDLSMDDLAKLVAEKDEALKLKHKEIEAMKDKVLRTYAEMENVMERTKREADNSKKFAIQNFAKSLLDVADNLGRASSVVKENFSKLDVSNDAARVVPLLKTLLEGVEMTEKQLLEVFKKFGVEKFDPANEPFDPHRHNAVFQIPDASKPPGTVAIVLKTGYTLYDRVIRPAEVGVTQAVDNEVAANDEAERSTEG